MYSILIQSEIPDRETLITKLWECGTTGILENSNTVQAFFEDDLAISQIASQLNYSVLEVKQETALANALYAPPDRDPVYAGRHFFIVSSDMPHLAPPDRKRLVIDAHNSFGSGSHESTQLVIQVLEEYPPVNATILDVGCGSGILSVVAQQLGASQAFACDTHLDALSSARMNSPDSYLFMGSIDALAPAFTDVVIVNISANAIDRLADELYRVVKPTGLLILAGFTTDRIPARVRPEKIFHLNDWLCWLCHPEGIERRQTQEALQPFPEQWW